MLSGETANSKILQHPPSLRRNDLNHS